MSRPVKMNSLLKLYFDRNILTPQKLLNYLKVDETFLNQLAGINLKLFKDYVNEKREYNITNLYKIRYQDLNLELKRSSFQFEVFICNIC